MARPRSRNYSASFEYLKRDAAYSGAFALAHLIVSPERAAYIQNVLWPEAEMRGRPGILASDPSKHFEMELRADRRLSEIEFPSTSEDSGAMDSDSSLRVAA